ncbi:MAG: DUF5702 domain-containing protein [Oscillospiraceae bacterium]|jgi:hypothetical protein|nr:DUF5702 domain-containing protein [Oscillospiraceae bacterium]
MKRKNSSHGTISVFLSIILVPLIAVTSLFADLSRVKLSGNLSTTAGDLALNSLLTHYDYDLSDFYGMVASCQTIDEFYDQSTQYFNRLMESKGLTPDERKTVWSKAGGTLEKIKDWWDGNKQVSNLLQTEMKSGPVFGPVPNANMANPTIIRDQIVDFMKYRAPIKIATDVIDRLKNSGGEDLKDADKDKKLIDEKQAYAEAEGKLLKAAFESYLAIKDYDNKNVTNQTFSDMAARLDEHVKAYKEINRVIVFDLANTNHNSTKRTEGINSGISRHPLDPFHNFTYTASEYSSINKETVKTSKEDGVYYITISKINQLFKEFSNTASNNGYLEKFNTAKTNLSNAGKAVEKPAGYYDIQYWNKLMIAIDKNPYLLDKYTKSAYDLCLAYHKLLAINECTLKDETLAPEDADWQAKLNTLLEKFTPIKNKYFSGSNNLKATSDLAFLWDAEALSNGASSITGQQNYTQVGYTSAWLGAPFKGAVLEEKIKSVNSALNNDLSALKEYKSLLDIAIDGKGSVPSLDKLLSLAQDFEDKHDIWLNTLDKTNTEYAKQEKGESKTLSDAEKEARKKEEKLKKEITGSNVNELKTRLSNIRSQVQGLIDAIDGLTYGGKKLSAINNTTDAISAAKGGGLDVNNIPTKQSDLQLKADDLFKNALKPQATPVKKLEHLTDAAYDPNIRYDSSKGIDNAANKHVPRLYAVFCDLFKDGDKSKVDSNQEAIDKKKKKGEDEKKKLDEEDNSAADAVPNVREGGSNFPSEPTGNSSGHNLGTEITGLVGLITSIINGNFDDLRDHLYATVYVMSMFSHGAYENQGKYDLLSDKDSATLSNYKTKYADSAIKTKWESTEPTFTKNKSLTLHMINSQNNKTYQSEIEYILYGKEKNSENLGCAYRDIYIIRLAVNLISGFKNFWSKDTNTGKAIEVIAVAVQSATAGIIPSVLTKCVLIVMLAALESVWDMRKLKAGFPVKLYKSDAKEWDWSLEGLTDISQDAKDPSTEKKDPEGLRYSDYILLFVCMGFYENNALSQQMYLRTADVMQANIAKLSNDSSYTLTKSYVYFNVDTTIRVKPLMLSLPILNSYSNNPKNSLDWCSYSFSATRGYS